MRSRQNSGNCANTRVGSGLLAVDDDRDAAELIARVAAKCGYDARFITDPRLLSQTLKDWSPEVVTLDLCMPQEDGMATLSELQKARFDGHVIIISGQDSSMRDVACRLAEVRGLKSAGDLSKPIDLPALRQMLTNLRLKA